MTVAELIAELEKMDPEASVFRNGHPDGGGLDEINQVEDGGYAKNNGYYCSYAGMYDNCDAKDEGAIKVVWLG